MAKGSRPIPVKSERLMGLLIGNNRRKYCCLSVGKIAVDGPIEELWYISVVYKALISTLPINGKSSCLSDRVLHCNHFRYNAVSKD